MHSPFVAEDLVLCRDWRQRNDTAAFYVLTSSSVIRGRCRASGQVVGPFCNEVSLEVVSLCKQAGPVVLGSLARLS